MQELSSNKSRYCLLNSCSWNKVTFDIVFSVTAMIFFGLITQAIISKLYVQCVRIKWTDSSYYKCKDNLFAKNKIARASSYFKEKITSVSNKIIAISFLLRYLFYCKTCGWFVIAIIYWLFHIFHWSLK